MTAWRPVRFSETRLRPGYSKAEVDAFIDRIEGTLGRAGHRRSG
jgi:DivIVA domain-containing protein